MIQMLIHIKYQPMILLFVNYDVIYTCSVQIYQLKCFYLHRSISQRQQFLQICSNCIRCGNTIQHKIDNQLTGMIISEIMVTIISSLPYFMKNNIKLPVKLNGDRYSFV